jgi:hypothetical protein
VKPGALSIGVASGAAVAVIAFAIVRVLERMLFLEPNPAALIWSEQSPFLWRCAIALYLGGAGVFGGHALAARSPRRAARWLFVALAAATAAIVIQGAFFA